MNKLTFPLLDDLRSNIKSCDEAINHVIWAQTGSDEMVRLEHMRDALGELAAIRVCLSDWINQEAKRRGEEERGVAS